MILHVVKELLRKILPFLSLGRVVYRVPWAEEVFLTFDDGPNPDFTYKILRVLKEYSVPATFFVQGSRAKEYPELINTIVAQGHAVANHTYSHVDLSTCKPEKIFREIQQCKKLFADHYILRPPYGGISLFSMLLSIALRYKIVFWSIDSLDHQGIPVEQIVNNVLQENPRSGDVILFHDDNEQTVESMKLIIESLRSVGIERFGKF